MNSNEFKQFFDEDYEQSLKYLVEYELENGAILKNNLSVNEVVEQFMTSNYSTLFDLKEFFE